MSEMEKSMNSEGNSTPSDTHDADRERVMRIVRFAGLFLIIVIIWYGLHLADIG
jgi:hypothetical protein